MKFSMLEDSSDPPSTPSRSVRDPIPSTTPLGPPPSASKSLFNPDQSRNTSSNLFNSRPQPFKSGVKSNQSLRGNSFGYTSSPPRDDLDDMMFEDNQESLAGISPGIRDFKASFLGTKMDTQRSPKRQKMASRRNDNSSVPDVKLYARGVVADTPTITLDTSDVLILRTEKAVEALTAEDWDPTNGAQAEAAASSTAKDLLALWNDLYPMDQDDVKAQEIGPASDQPPPLSAVMLASLLLPLQHPSASHSKQVKKGRLDKSIARHGSVPDKSVPEVLITWLNGFHEPGAEVIRSVELHTGQFFAAPEFWDAIMSSLIRGNISTVIKFLSQANVRKTSSDEYTNPQLDYIEEAMNTMIELLETCPALAQDWNVSSASWDIFRQEVGQVKTELRKMYEGEDGELVLGNSQPSFSLSRASRQVESRLPQDIYDVLVDMCDVMLCDENAIKNSAFDWVEAVACLTIWWDGEDADGGYLSRSDLRQSLSASTRSLRKSQSRPVDVTPILAYRQRLSDAFHLMHEEDELAQMVEWNNPFHVALSCVFENELEGALSIIRTYSISISAAIVDVGSLGGWLTTSALRSRELDEEDLMVLSYANDNSKLSIKDETLRKYAQLLSTRDVLEDPENDIRVEGWDLALSVLSRLDSGRVASDSALALVETIDLQSNSRVDKILDICNQLGFTDQSTRVAEKYADQLAEAGSSYGDSLFYYARGHKTDKLKDVLHGLITLCVVQSSAYPAPQDLDETLQKFLKSPRRAVRLLNANDYDASHSLSTYLSGYATIRKFYEVRDEQVDIDLPADPVEAKLERKRWAAAALLPTIISAANSIQGGTLDNAIDSVVPVDHLLVLLGEALVFFNQPVPILTLSQLTSIVKVVEDLDSVDQQVYERCESSFSATVGNAHDFGTSSPYDLLKKSISNLTTASSQFSMIGSSMLKSQILNAPPSTTASTEGSGVLLQQPIPRAWDWRKAMKKNSSSRDILKILRLGLAKDLARVWLDETEGS